MTSEYQRTHRSYPCRFCCRSNETVCGHHIRITAGMGQKPHDALAIPVCYSCHRDCHDGTISKQEQLEVWVKYMLERMTEQHGREKGVELMALAYWSVL